MAKSAEPRDAIREALRTIGEKFLGWHLIAGAGVVVAIFFLLPDLREKKLTPWGVFGTFISAVFLLIDFGMKNSFSEKKFSESLSRVEIAVEKNTKALRAHEELLTSRTVDNLTLIAFKNLLAYLPFYLAEDLGYLQDEHIAITDFTSRLDDQSTAQELLRYPKNSVAICDPYMCVTNPGLRLVYPICRGVAAWPMTLNWIGSASSTEKAVRIASYKAPSTTYVLAQLVADRIITPRLEETSNIPVTVVELDDDEARFGENEARDEVSKALKSLLMKYDVVMLWEPHCELALRLGARYVFKGNYEEILNEFGPELMYSGLVIADEIVRENPTLPIRLGRAMDRAVARLRDPLRLSYCELTLGQRSLLLNPNDKQICESVLSRLAENIPLPTNARTLKTPGWRPATSTWAQGMFAADRLRRSLIRSRLELKDKLQFKEHNYSDASDFHQLIYVRSEESER